MGVSLFAKAGGSVGPPPTEILYLSVSARVDYFNLLATLPETLFQAQTDESGSEVKGQAWVL